jgi:simple sugar transport system ATP-binding protein
VSEALGCTGLTKRYGDIVANREVTLSVGAGSVHAVIGENGAGKSTLMKALYGLEPPDSGEVRLRGEVVARPSVAEALRRGVGMVHQHFMLVPTLTVAENVMLGREVRRGLLLDVEAAARELEALSAKFGLALDPRRLVSELGVGEAQRVEIVKVLWRGAEVLILDEPTAVLTPPEVDDLFRVLRGLVKDGKTIVLVTHKLDEVLALADQVTVMRRGEVVDSVAARETTAPELARLMVGREIQATIDRPRAPVAADAPVRLSVDEPGIAFQIRAGEILGIAGVEGNGQTELVLRLAAAGRNTFAHIPEDRQGRGLVLSMSLAHNLLLGRDDVYARPLHLDFQRLDSDARALVARYDVRPPDPTAAAGSLSGGNQQKIVVGRELLRNPSVVLCAQPTRGVDVGAIERIHEELLAARAQGCAILLVSAELDELLGLADRIAVMYRGKIAGILDAKAATREKLGALMLGAQ